MALLQRDAAATEQLVHRNEFIALGLQLVNGHQDAVHRGGVDVVRQHDRAVKGSLDDVRADGTALRYFQSRGSTDQRMAGLSSSDSTWEL